MSATIDARLIAAAAIAREAGTLARTFFGDPHLNVKLKGPQDYVTEADGTVERMIVGRLDKLFPDDTFLGEENGGKLSDRLWIIDPIDGTANFARNIGHYAVSIAYVEKCAPVVAAVYDPTLDHLYTARKGAGAYRDGVPIHASTCSHLATASLELGFCRRYPTSQYMRLLDGLLQQGANVRWAGSAVLALAYVAEGRNDGYCDIHLNSWDGAAGMLLVAEAGGWVNEFLSGGGIIEGNPMVACASGLSAQLLSCGASVAEPQTLPR